MLSKTAADYNGIRHVNLAKKEVERCEREHRVVAKEKAICITIRLFKKSAAAPLNPCLLVVTLKVVE